MDVFVVEILGHKFHI